MPDYEDMVSELEGQLPKRVRDRLLDRLQEEQPSKKVAENTIEKVIEDYKESQYEPGEAIGVVAAQSISEPATQMSLDAEEKVIVKKGGRARTAEIGEFVDKAIQKESKENGEWEIRNLSSEEIFVPSLTQDEKIEWKKVLECSRHPAPDELLKIETASGRKITATDSHSFVVRREGGIKPVAGKDLEPGERIPVMKNLKENCTAKLEVSSKIDTKWAKKKLPERMDLDEKFGWFVGTYLAEGNCTKNYVSISNRNPEFNEKIREFAKSYNFTFNEYEHERGFSRTHDTRINSRLLSKLLKKTCGTGSKDKKVPEFAYSAEPEFVAGLLRGYFDGDGNISAEKKMLRASSNSKELINGVLLLLSRFGIFGSKLDGKQFSLLIPYKYADKFSKKIGFSVENKSQKIEKIKGTPKQEFIDMIPGCGPLLKKIAEKVEYPTRYVNNFSKRDRIGRETLHRYIRLFEEEAEGKDAEIDDEISKLKEAVEGDVVWDKIENIERVQPTSDYVYDFSVEDTETFTTFEGVVTHNTMRTYHVAGAAQGVEITQGLPRLIEIVDARKTIKTPSMDVYLKGDYQDKEEAKKAANRIKETKLENITSEDRIDLLNLVLEIELDEQSMEDTNLEMEDVVSQLNKGRRKYEAELEEDVLKIVPKDEDVSVRDLQKMKNKVLDKHLKGIKGISQAVLMEEEGEWKIQTLGTNLKKVLKIEGVDPTRTVSGDPREMQKVFGIEACRNTILEEGHETIQEQGLDVDIRHMMLVADTMTVDGEIKAIGRYGVAGEKGSVLARASFEVTVRHLTDAAIEGEADELNSTVENVIINQTVPAGTGMYDVVYKPQTED